MANLVRISEAGSLALHAMALLAQRQDRMTGTALAAALDASANHMAKVMLQLARAGLVHSLRGPAGGFSLAMPARRVTLLAIYEAVEGPLSGPTCLLSRPQCTPGDTGCGIGCFAFGIHERVRKYLATTSLAAAAKKYPRGRSKKVPHWE